MEEDAEAGLRPAPRRPVAHRVVVRVEREAVPCQLLPVNSWAGEGELTEFAVVGEGEVVGGALAAVVGAEGDGVLDLVPHRLLLLHAQVVHEERHRVPRSRGKRRRRPALVRLNPHLSSVRSKE